MATKRQASAKVQLCIKENYAQPVVSLVPSTLSSPLGILDITALQFLLSSPTRSSTQARELTEGDIRPASSEIERAYGVSSSSGDTASNCRRHVVERKKPRRPAPSMLAPLSTPKGEGKPLKLPHVHPARLPKNCVSNRHGAASIESVPCAVEATTTSMSRNPVVRPSAHLYDGKDNKLKQEIQWIYAHLPVRRLVNAKCSLALRRRVLTETLRTNLSRAWLRDALVHWRWCIAKQKQVEASKLKAFGQLVDLFTHVLRGQIEHRFMQWRNVVAMSQDLEREAAAVSIQRWLVECQMCCEAQQTRTSLRVASTVAAAVAKATMIQRIFRGFAARQRLAKSRYAVVKIQRWMQSTRRRRQVTEQHEARRRMEELYAREQRLQLLLARSRASQADRIITRWRQYAAWRERIALDCVHDLVDLVEFSAAVHLIQSHIRGYQCRLRVKLELQSAHFIQQAWRKHLDRQRGRQQKKMIMLTHNMAARCLQRTFQRGCERKKHGTAMQKSTRPMYMRALVQTPSFRQRFYVPIVKSAVSVIQSTWRWHIQYQRWKAARHAAAHRIQRWQRTVRRLFQLQHIVCLVVCHVRERSRLAAVRKLRRWLRRCLCSQRELKDATRTQQLLETLHAMVALQRQYRRKHDRWRRLGHTVLLLHLPRWRRAASRIAHCWRKYCLQKQRVVRSLHGLDVSTGNVGSQSLSELQALLKLQHRELVRQNQAARGIQRTWQRFQAKRDGKLLLKRYKVLFQKELRRRQQRSVIHGFLVEKLQERVKRSQLEVQVQGPQRGDVAMLASSSPLSLARAPPPPSSSSALPPTATTTPLRATHQSSPMEAADGSASSGVRDDPDVVVCWSDEYACSYRFNTRTGESTWSGG